MYYLRAKTDSIKQARKASFLKLVTSLNILYVQWFWTSKTEFNLLIKRTFSSKSLFKVALSLKESSNRSKLLRFKTGPKLLLQSSSVLTRLKPVNSLLYKFINSNVSILELQITSSPLQFFFKNCKTLTNCFTLLTSSNRSRPNSDLVPNLFKTIRLDFWQACRGDPERIKNSELIILLNKTVFNLFFIILTETSTTKKTFSLRWFRQGRVWTAYHEKHLTFLTRPLNLGLTELKS